METHEKENIPECLWKDIGTDNFLDLYVKLDSNGNIREYRTFPGIVTDEEAECPYCMKTCHNHPKLEDYPDIEKQMAEVWNNEIGIVDLRENDIYVVVQ